MDKKGQMGLGALQPIVLSLTVAAVIAVVGLKILGTLRDSQTVGSAEYNASDTMVTAISDNVVSNFGIIALIAVFAVVLGLVALFALRR